MKNRCLAAVLLLFTALSALAQTDGTYSGFSPYSVFGPGLLHQGGTAWNRGMGGVGVAARNHRFVNIVNPASITARDSLSFMADFGVDGRFAFFSEGDKRGVNNIVNIDDFLISFPMWKHTAMMLGVTPYSDVGYKITYSELNPYYQKSTFTSAGNGGLYKVFDAVAVTLWERLSLGAEFNFIFGNINKSATLTYTDDSYRSSASGDSLQVRNFSARLGLQYEQPLGRGAYLTVGATYKFSTPMLGYSIHYRELGSYYRERADASLTDKGVRLGDELGVGISYRKADNLLIEVDYSRSNWSNSALETVPGLSNVGDVVFNSSVGQSFRAGFEYTPNRNDIRYFLKRCTYRAGAYFDQSYYTVDGAHVNTIGLTLGMTLPVFRWYNGLSVGVELGRRGLATSQVKETYIGFNVGFNIFDIWFQKRPYE
ncbi:MAG: hypothetical protein J6M31_07985 [Bacteroidales bacterium]|nr:hypothetical protein [Bacteroidales bacterium]